MCETRHFFSPLFPPFLFPFLFLLFPQFLSASIRMNGFITCLVNIFFKTLKLSCYCGSRRHLRGRTAFQADTERIPCCPGALSPVTHSTAFQAGLSCLLFVVDSIKPCSNLLLFLAKQDANLCKCMVGFGEASRVTSYCH